MQDLIQKRDEFERAWKDPSFVRRWNRQRKSRFRDLRQETLRDADGAWNRDPALDSGLDDGGQGPWSFPAEPAIKATHPRQEFVLPDPVRTDSGVKYPLAIKAGASAEQQAQASAMFEAGLKSKAKRKAHCGVLGQRWDCASNSDHSFFMPYRCGNRYCEACGPGIFSALFAKHLRLTNVVKELVPHWPVFGHRPSRVIAKIDFTIRNTGKMQGPAAVKKFNRDLRKFFRLLERRLGISRKAYGVVWCNEFGGSNTNLHAHGVYAGPYLPQKKKELSRMWSEVVKGSGFVSIKAARSFPAALAHALKYSGKHVSASNPTRLAELEKTFHRVRRVHALAAFYNFKPGDASKSENDWGAPRCCPICESSLYRPSGWHMRTIAELEKAGLRNFWELRREGGRDRVFGGPQGVPP